MSLITLLVVKNNKLSISEMHYRQVISILESSCFGLYALPDQDEPAGFLDAGYLLIDLDRRLIISCQSAFSINHLQKSVKQGLFKGWRVEENG